MKKATHKEALRELSEAIYGLESPLAPALHSLLTPGSVRHVAIYRRNLFGQVYGVLVQDFPVLETYLSPDNLRFLVKEFLLSAPLTSANIFAASHGFKDFLRHARSATIHQDQHVPHLAALDYFWSYAPCHENQELVVPEGMVALWQYLRRHGRQNLQEHAHTWRALAAPGAMPRHKRVAIRASGEGWILMAVDGETPDGVRGPSQGGRLAGPAPSTGRREPDRPTALR